MSAGKWRILNAREAAAEPADREPPRPAEGISHQVHSWRNKIARMAAAGAARSRRAYGNAFRHGW